MTLTDDQKAAVLRWIEEGDGPSEIQKRLKEEFQVGLTYLETRLLADDLKLQFKDPEPVPEPVAPPETLEPVAAPGSVSVTIDQITRPGSMISGRTTFSDGETAGWYLDQSGRLGLDPSKPDYRPSESDVAAFQAELEKIARKQGI
jgi:hypothetical protein